jgi:hypothetical protein
MYFFFFLYVYRPLLLGDNEQPNEVVKTRKLAEDLQSQLGVSNVQVTSLQCMYLSWKWRLLGDWQASGNHFQDNLHYDCFLVKYRALQVKVICLLD